MDLSRPTRRAALLACAIVAGCGGAANVNDAGLRLLNVSTGYASLDLFVDDERQIAAVASGNASASVDVSNGAATLALRNAGGTTTLLSSDQTLSKSTGYTLVAYGAQGALKTTLLTDDSADIGSSSARLRVLNAAPEAGAVDVYLSDTCADTADFAGAVSAASGLAAGAASAWVDSGAGNVCVRVTGPGATGDLRLALPALVLGAQQRLTLVLGPTRGGVLMQAWSVLQGADGVNAFPSTSARVRLAAGVAAATTVQASLGGTALSPDLASPGLGSYVLVAAGTRALGLTVGGSAQAASNLVLAPGADYSLMVSGSAAAPVADLIEDDNRLRSDATRATLRLVHGHAAFAGLTLTADASPVGNAAPYRGSSGYASVAAGTTIDLEVSGASIKKTDQTLAAGSVYTLFVLGGEAGSPTGILRRDR